MSESKKQVLVVRSRKGVSTSLSDEYQRNWSEKAWRHAVDNGNYDRSREGINFEIGYGCTVQPVDKSRSVDQRMKDILTDRGIRNPNDGLDVPKYRTIADFLFSGNHDRMCELAFGNQTIDYSKGADNSSVVRMPEIEEWAKDIYRFVCDQYGEENIVQFICHCDETSPHIHVAVLPIDERNNISFKKVIAGKDKFEFSRRISALHDKLAVINARWGLERGRSTTTTKSKHRSTEEYRRELSEINSELERRIQEHSFTLSELESQIRLAERRQKGLTTMVANLEAHRAEVLAEIDRLKELADTNEAKKDQILEEIRRKTEEIKNVDKQIADKSEKLDAANRILEDLKDETFSRKIELDAIKEDIRKSRGTQSQQVMSQVAEAGYREIVSTFSNLVSQMTSEKDKQLFDGTLLKDMAERGKEISMCAGLLFLGYIDQATQFAEGHGGGGGGSDLPWGRKDDEDDRAWMQRCLHQAHKMMRPSAVRNIKRK